MFTKNNRCRVVTRTPRRKRRDIDLFFGVGGRFGRVTRLLLIRHGESISTVERRIGGHRTCTGLSPLGVAQAQRLRDRFSTTEPLAADVLISSHYPRARHTAEIIAAAIGCTDVVVEPGFGEHDPGETCDGLTYTEFVDRYGGADMWQHHDPFATTFPGGETVAAMHYRVGTALRTTLDTHDAKTIVVSCHGGVIDAVLRILMRTPAMGAFELLTLNTSITEFVNTRPAFWRMVRYNDSAHLAGLPLGTVPTPENPEG